MNATVSGLLLLSAMAGGLAALAALLACYAFGAVRDKAPAGAVVLLLLVAAAGCAAGGMIRHLLPFWLDILIK